MILDSWFDDAVHCCRLQHLRVIRVRLHVTTSASERTAAAPRARVIHTRTVVPDLVPVKVALFIIVIILFAQNITVTMSNTAKRQ